MTPPALLQDYALIPQESVFLYNITMSAGEMNARAVSIVGLSVALLFLEETFQW